MLYLSSLLFSLAVALILALYIKDGSNPELCEMCYWERLIYFFIITHVSICIMAIQVLGALKLFSII